MANYLLIESRDPYDSNDTQFVIDLARQRRPPGDPRQDPHPVDFVPRSVERACERELHAILRNRQAVVPLRECDTRDDAFVPLVLAGEFHESRLTGPGPRAIVLWDQLTQGLRTRRRRL